MRATAIVARTGIPHVAVIAEGFYPQATAIAKSQGLEAAHIVKYPGVPLSDPDDDFARKVDEVVVPAVLQALRDGDATTAAPAPTADDEFEPEQIVASGDLDAIHDVFERRLWSDGLPFVPPTLDRVAAFVDRAGRPGSDVLGLLPPANREATVWNVAANAVMAGCRAEYMPLLVRIVECLAEPSFRLEDAGSTPGWEVQAVVSGAIADELGFNAGTGATRAGRRANSTVGRFVRLYLRNVCGLQIPPGTTDQAVFGLNFLVALAEDEAACVELGWPTFREDEGFRRAASTVSVQSVVTVSSPIYTGGSTPEQTLDPVAVSFVYTMGGWSNMGQYKNEVLYPLLVVSPAVAQVLARNGWSKDDVRSYLAERMSMKASILNLCQPGYNLEDTARGRRLLVDAGVDPDAYDAAAVDVPVLPDPELLGIVVAGNPTRAQCRVLIGNQRQGVRITKAIDTV